MVMTPSAVLSSLTVCPTLMPERLTSVEGMRTAVDLPHADTVASRVFMIKKISRDISDITHISLPVKQLLEVAP
jgi:hypothetical protein